MDRSNTSQKRRVAAVAAQRRSEPQAVAVAMKSGDAHSARGSVRFGNVTVSVQKPTRADVEHNVSLSTQALERAKHGLIRGWVRIPAKKNVPLFYADPAVPGRFIRRLNGRTESGVLENGLFKVVD